jgi:anti-sigma regulatory factor (Ser/Thr protein kinase)
VPVMTIPPRLDPCLQDWEVSAHLHADAHAPRLCRRAVTGVVREYGVPGVAEDGALVAGELMTNAVQHGLGPVAFRVAWYAVRARLRLTVWDEGKGRAPVRPREPGPDAEHGRGLLIVSALAADWGQYSTPSGGKAVWAELAPCGDGFC